MTLKNKQNKIILAFIMMCSIAVCQKNRTTFKYDLKFYFDESMISGNRLTAWGFKDKTNKDSTFQYFNSEKKVSILFKVKNSKAACSFTLIDSLSNIIINGEFKEGLALLCDQIDFTDADGSAVVMLRKYYAGIPDGKWIYTDLNGAFLKNVVYKKKRGK
jgi:hypothetical protein